jgi:hypothetical protein
MIMAKKSSKHMRSIWDFFYTIARRNIRGAVSAFVELGAGDQTGHPSPLNVPAVGNANTSKANSEIGFFLSLAEKAKRGRGGAQAIGRALIEHNTIGANYFVS